MRPTAKTAQQIVMPQLSTVCLGAWRTAKPWRGQRQMDEEIPPWRCAGDTHETGPGQRCSQKLSQKSSVAESAQIRHLLVDNNSG